MMWIPNLFVKAVAGITSWFAGLLGFKEEAKEIAEAGKEFNIGDLIFKAVEAISKWFGDLFDSIINFDFAGMARGLMPDFLADMIFGKEKPKAKKAEEPMKKSLAEQAKEAEKELAEGGSELKEDVFSGLAGMFDLGNLMKPVRDKIESVFADVPFFVPDAVAGFMKDTLLKILPEPTKVAEGGLIGMGPIAGGSMAKAMGLESGGLFTLSQGEFVLDNQAAAMFLQAAHIMSIGQLSAMNTGPELINLQRQQNELGGGGAGGAPVNITDASTTISNQSQPLILPTLDIAPDNPENSRLTSG